MTKNPLLNALAALAYIILVATAMQLGSKMVPHTKSFLAPVAFISLFTLSAAVMGYVFCYQPIMLYFDDKKKLGVRLFLNTVLVFGSITAVFLVLLFSGIIK